MSKSILYVANPTSTTVTAGNAIPLGSVIRRYGCGTNVGATTIYINSPGYYDVDFAGTFTGTAGDVTVNVVSNGLAIAGATASETITTATTEIHSISIPTVTKIYCCAGATLSVMVASDSTSTPTFSNIALRVEKI